MGVLYICVISAGTDMNYMAVERFDSFKLDALALNCVGVSLNCERDCAWWLNGQMRMRSDLEGRRNCEYYLHKL